VAVATAHITASHFASEVDFREFFAFRTEVEDFAARRVMVEFHLEVTVEQAAVGAGVIFLPALHEKRGLALRPRQ
jgi:hypothetical protein